MEQTIKNTEPVDIQPNDSPAQPEQGLFQSLFSKQTLQQLIKYFITGVLSFGTEVALLSFFTEVCQLWYIYSNSLAFLIVFIISFTLNRRWAFKSKQPFLKQFITSGLLFALNLIVCNWILYFFTETVKFHYLFSKVIATGSSVTWNFFLYKYYVYK